MADERQTVNYVEQAENIWSSENISSLVEDAGRILLTGDMTEIQGSELGTQVYYARKCAGVSLTKGSVVPRFVEGDVITLPLDQPARLTVVPIGNNTYQIDVAIPGEQSTTTSSVTVKVPQMAIGTVTDLNAGDSATASIDTLSENSWSLNLGIPRGPKGEKGEKGETGDKGPDGENYYKLGLGVWNNREEIKNGVGNYLSRTDENKITINWRREVYSTNVVITPRLANFVKFPSQQVYAEYYDGASAENSYILDLNTWGKDWGENNNQYITTPKAVRDTYNHCLHIEGDQVYPEDSYSGNYNKINIFKENIVLKEGIASHVSIDSTFYFSAFSSVYKKDNMFYNTSYISFNRGYTGGNTWYYLIRISIIDPTYNKHGPFGLEWYPQADVSGNNTNYHITAGTVVANAKQHTCGSPDFRFKSLYSVNTNIYTSDLREKQNILIINNNYTNINYKIFNFNKSNKKTFGLVVQDFLQIKDIFKYSFICYDTWKDKNNRTTDRYGLRYLELLCNEANYFRGKLSSLEERVAVLEQKKLNRQGAIA